MHAIVTRAKSVVLTPQTEWPAIERSADAPVPVIRYVAILALIPALSRFIGASLIGGYTSMLAGLAGAAVAYALTFAVAYLVALMVNMLAPTFGGEKNFDSALKLTVYSFTPAWIAGIFLLVPGLSFLGVLGLYGAYVMWAGLPVLMKAPAARALPYAATVVGWAVALDLAVRAILAATVNVMQ
jgi:hypothetical protein